DWQKRREQVHQSLQSWVEKNVSVDVEDLYSRLKGWADCFLLWQYVVNLERELRRPIASGVLVVSESDYWQEEVLRYLPAGLHDCLADLYRLVLSGTLPIQPGLISKERLEMFEDEARISY